MSAPILYWMILQNKLGIALLLSFISAITDWADGYVARTFNSTTVIGKILDPIADKIFIFCATLGLYKINLIPLWLLSAIIIRDVFILLGGAILFKNKKTSKIKVLKLSKVNTLFQMVLIIYLLCPVFYNVYIHNFLIYLTLLTTFFSGIYYARFFKNACRQ